MSDLRVGTWNVQYARGVERNRARLDLLGSWMADVWVLTETGCVSLRLVHAREMSEVRAGTTGREAEERAMASVGR